MWYPGIMEPAQTNTTIEVGAETAKRLRALAQKEGLSIDGLLTVYVPGLSTSEASQEMTPAERSKSFREWAESHRRDLPPLSDEAVSRKSFYE
jgi:hypothetical protein